MFPLLRHHSVSYAAHSSTSMLFTVAIYKTELIHWPQQIFGIKVNTVVNKLNFFKQTVLYNSLPVANGKTHRSIGV